MPTISPGEASEERPRERGSSSCRGMAALRERAMDMGKGIIRASGGNVSRNTALFVVGALSHGVLDEIWIGTTRWGAEEERFGCREP
jgi:hypothetical protein